MLRSLPSRKAAKTLLYTFLGTSFDGTDCHPGEFPIANFAGQTGVLTVTLHSASTTASELRVTNFQFLAQQAPLHTLRLTGAGHITGDAIEGTVLTVRQTYTVRAVPGAGEIFGGWSGSIVSDDARLTFTMQEGLEIVANFIANPFPAVRGPYVGLVETEPFARGMSGSVKARVTGTGSFTAVLAVGTETLRFAGAFDPWRADRAGEFPRHPKDERSRWAAALAEARVGRRAMGQ